MDEESIYAGSAFGTLVILWTLTRIVPTTLMNATTTPFTRSRGIANESTVDSPEANLAISSMIIITLMLFFHFASFPPSPFIPLMLHGNVSL